MTLPRTHVKPATTSLKLKATKPAPDFAPAMNAQTQAKPAAQTLLFSRNEKPVFHKIQSERDVYTLDFITDHSLLMISPQIEKVMPGGIIPIPRASPAAKKKITDIHETTLINALPAAKNIAAEQLGCFELAKTPAELRAAEGAVAPCLESPKMVSLRDQVNAYYEDEKHQLSALVQGALKLTGTGPTSKSDVKSTIGNDYASFVASNITSRQLSDNAQVTRADIDALPGKIYARNQAEQEGLARKNVSTALSTYSWTWVRTLWTSREELENEAIENNKARFITEFSDAVKTFDIRTGYSPVTNVEMKALPAMPENTATEAVTPSVSL